MALKVSLTCCGTVQLQAAGERHPTQKNPVMRLLVQLSHTIFGPIECGCEVSIIIKSKSQTIELPVIELELSNLKD